MGKKWQGNGKEMEMEMEWVMGQKWTRWNGNGQME